MTTCGQTPNKDCDEMLQRAAREGARQALASIGLHDENAAEDVRDLRDVLKAWRTTKSEALKVAVGLVVKGVFLAVIAGAVVKLGLLSKTPGVGP